MHHLNLILTLLGGLVLVIGLMSKALKRTPVPSSLLALVFGIVVGPEVTGVLDLHALGDPERILEGAARLTLGLGLVGIALRLPCAFPYRHWKAMAKLIGLAMPAMWLISSLLVYVILGVQPWMAMLIGAIITATDPIAATPIVTGPVAMKNVPERIRHSISFESGANDGLGYLFVFLPFLMLTRPTGEAIQHWLTSTLLYDVVVATALGLLFGYVAGRLLRVSREHDAIGKHWRAAFTVALALIAVGAGRLIGSDEVLVAFAVGIAFVRAVGDGERSEAKPHHEAVNRFFSIPFFALLGAALPWSGWWDLGWAGVLLAVAILLLRRPPVLLALRPVLPGILHRADALYMGWFGPIAVAAIYYSTLMTHRLHDPLVWHVVSLVVCASIIAHGITSTPLTRVYGRHADMEKTGRPGLRGTAEER